MRTAGGAVSGAILGQVGNANASGFKEIMKGAGEVFAATTAESFVEDYAYNRLGGANREDSAKSAAFSSLISGTMGAGFYAAGQAVRNMCFVEGTMVLTAEGLIAIECIAVGDMVIATNPEIGETAKKEVKNTFVNETEELAHVFVGGEEIVCTPGHKFYAPEKGWTSAIELRAGDQLQLVNGEYVTVEKVQHELLEEPVKVYNFEVEDFHTYYVGTDVQVLVHNMCKQEKTYVVRGEELTEKQFTLLRKKAVRQAWKDEVELVKRTGRGTRDWTDAEIHELLTKGKVKGYEGQHMKSAEAFPDYVDVPDNIQFLKGRNMDENEHLAAHGGDYKNPTNGYYDPKTKTFIDFGDTVPWEGR